MSMHGSGNSYVNGWSKGRLARGAAAALMIAALAGCSAVPDWAKPSAIFGDSKAAESPADSSGFPELANVPDQKPGTTSPAQQKEIANSLAADRADAKHTDEVLRGGTEPPAPAPQVADPTPVKPLKDVPPEALANEKKSSNDDRKVLPMPATGGHASLADVTGVKTASADVAKSDTAEKTGAADGGDAKSDEPSVKAAPTTPVEVKPADDADKAKL